MAEQQAGGDVRISDLKRQKYTYTSDSLETCRAKMATLKRGSSEGKDAEEGKEIEIQQSRNGSPVEEEVDDEDDDPDEKKEEMTKSIPSENPKASEDENGEEDDDVIVVRRTASAICTSMSLRHEIDLMQEKTILEHIKAQKVHSTSVTLKSGKDVLRESLVFALAESVRLLGAEDARKCLVDVLGERNASLIDSLMSSKESSDSNLIDPAARTSAASASFLRFRMKNARTALHQPMLESAHRFHGLLPEDAESEDELTAKRTQGEVEPPVSPMSTPPSSPRSSSKDLAPKSSWTRFKLKSCCPPTKQTRRARASDAESCGSSTSSLSSDESRHSSGSRRSKGSSSGTKRKSSKKSHNHRSSSAARRSGKQHHHHHKSSSNGQQPHRYHSQKRRKPASCKAGSVNRGFFSLLFSKMHFSMDGLSKHFRKKKAPCDGIRGILKTSGCTKNQSCKKSVRFGTCAVFDEFGQMVNCSQLSSQQEQGGQELDRADVVDSGVTGDANPSPAQLVVV